MVLYGFFFFFPNFFAFIVWFTFCFPGIFDIEWWREKRTGAVMVLYKFSFSFVTFSVFIVWFTFCFLEILILSLMCAIHNSHFVLYMYISTHIELTLSCFAVNGDVRPNCIFYVNAGDVE